MSCLAKTLPNWMRTPLFGDRDQFGLVPDEQDADWIEWQGRYSDFYESTQKGGVGKRVNDAGYAVLRAINLSGKQVAEIGPGNMPHRDFWNGTPEKFTAIDISQEFLDLTAKKVDCPFEAIHLSEREQKLPIADNQFDVLLTFYSLEHLHPLSNHLQEYHRILKPGGLLVGAIPNEGGLAWGLGRFLTSRRWIKKNTTLNYDKIICWEHPNFADAIIAGLDQQFEREHISMYPIPFVPCVDTNLVTKFRYRKAVS